MVWEFPRVPSICRIIIRAQNQGVLVDNQRGFHFEIFQSFFDGKWYLKHASRHWTGGVCKSNCDCNDKTYAQSSKTWEIALDGSGGKCGLYTKLMSDEGLALCYTQMNVEWEEALHCTHARIWKPCICNGPDNKRGKLDAKGVKCVFLGYCEDMKAYRLMCLKQEKS